MESYPIPRTVEQVFRDFMGRRAGIIKALTTDAEEFYRKCDPEKRIHLCLYGFPDERWEVNLPLKHMVHLPQPPPIINFARNGILMQQKDRLFMVALRSHAWLLSVAFWFAATFEFDRADRQQLFHMINDLPTISEVVRVGAEELTEEKHLVPSDSCSSKESTYKQGHESQPIDSKAVTSKDKGEDNDGTDDDEHGETFVRGRDSTGALWICCGVCKKRIPGKSVMYTPEWTEHKKQYKCQSCQPRP